MKSKQGITIGVIAFVVLAISAYAFMQQTVAPQEAATSDSSDMAEESMMDENTTDDMSADSMSDESADPTAMASGSYEEFSPEKLARAEEGDVVLFFHASWCPSCRGLNSDLEQNREAIPSELSILKLNYDTETDLRKKYEVTYQHTLVQVDSEGNLIKKWSGSPTLASLSSEVQ